MFVHGWTCDEASWKEQVPVFAKNYRVITIDLPGHGKSAAPKDKPLSMDVFARAIEAVRVEAKANKIVLVGHSMGSPVIIGYARRYPANVAALVPVDGGLTMRGGTPNLDRFKGPDGLKAREGMIRGMFGPGATPAIQHQILKTMLGTSEKTAVEASAAMFDNSGAKQDPMPFPMLGVWAGGAPAEQEVKNIFPNGKAVNLSGTGHFLMLEKPAEFNKLLADFLATVK
jgi:pimeloyl-ACP methyl ester carboxylesterase